MTIVRHAEMRRTVLACIAFLATAAPAGGYRLPKNPRHQRKAAPAPAKVGVTLIDRLEPGRWDPKVKLALEVFAAEHGKESPGYDPSHPPAALLAFDDAAVAGDLGELVFQRFVEKAEFKFDEAWWQIVPLAHGRQRIRAAQEQFYGLPPSVWGAQPAYHQFWKYMIQSYEDTCRLIDRKDCRIYLARLFKGYRRDEVVAYAKKVFDDEEIAPMAVREIRESPEDASPARIRGGLREIPEMKDLCRLLLKAGFDVWVVDLEAQPLLIAYAASYGIDPARVIGIRQAVYKERILGKVEDPVPTRGGKVDAAVAALGRPPTLVVGASDDDREILGYGNGQRLLLDRGNRPLRDLARRRGWLVQPAFAP